MTQYQTSVGIIHTLLNNADERSEFYLIIDKLREKLRGLHTYQEIKSVALEYLQGPCGVSCRKNASATVIIDALLRHALAGDGRWAYIDGELARVADRLSRIEPHETINPDDQISADAIEHLANWALEQSPPLDVIAACDRALYWAGKQKVDEAQSWKQTKISDRAKAASLFIRVGALGNSFLVPDNNGYYRVLRISGGCFHCRRLRNRELCSGKGECYHIEAVRYYLEQGLDKAGDV